MSKKSESERDRHEAIAKLHKLLKPGASVYTVLRHVSNSGMFRVIDLAIPIREYREEYPPQPEAQQTYPGARDYSAKPRRTYPSLRIRSIGYLAAQAMGDKFDGDRQGIKISGCGQDMGFALVYGLGCKLWPNGTPKPHGMRNGEPDSAGGYALKHQWL